MATDPFQIDPNRPFPFSICLEGLSQNPPIYSYLCDTTTAVILLVCHKPPADEEGAVEEREG
eukprot:COSAG01_NODE_2538_length_7480_cov_167.793930_1_plen_62_part_00